MFAIQMMGLRAVEYLRTLRDEEAGQGMVEYGLILVLISVAAVSTMTTLGEDISELFTNIAGDLGF